MFGYGYAAEHWLGTFASYLVLGALTGRPGGFASEMTYAEKVGRWRRVFAIDADGSMDAGDLPRLVALAKAADLVRGYGHIKEASVVRYRAECDRVEGLLKSSFAEAAE